MAAPLRRRARAGLRMNGGAGLGKLGRERARERGERVVEPPGMLMRAIDGGSGVLRCSGHGGGEVAAARSFGGGVAMEGSPSAMAKGGGEFLGDAWKPRGAGGGAGRRPRAAAGGARHRRRERAERDRQGKGKRGPFAISKISRDLNVKQG